MEPVLIYTDSSFVDVGAVRSFSMDMAFGSDEQDFEISFSEPVLSGGELLYIDGTEYGGIIDAVTQSTETDAIVYTGRTWHGMLAGKIIKPPTGSDYYTLSGDANACIRSLLAYVDLDGILTGRATASGISVNYQFNRFTNAYDGLLRMLSDAGAVLRIERHDGITELWAEPRTLIEDEADSDIMDFAITDSVRVTNHLVCAGEGELQDRVIVDLYADADGNVSQTQTLTGVDEIAVFYNYSNADQEQLIEDGTKELKSYQNGGGADLQVNSKGDWHVGDLLQVRDNRTGLVITSTIGKKIVKVSKGVLSVDYEIGDATAQSYGGGAQAETSLITPIANGGTGASTVEGARDNLDVPGLSVSNVFTVASQYIQLDNVDITLADNGVASNLYPGLKLRDKNGNQFAVYESAVYPNGTIRTSMYVRNMGTGSAITNGVWMDVRNDGTRYVGVSDPAAWRDALGIGALREANGSSVQIASNTGVDTCSISLPAGLWLISGGINYAANSTGERYLHLTKTSKATNNERVAAAITRASNSGASLMSITCPFNLTATTTIYLVGWQNSGSTISAAGYISAVKVG